MDRPESLHTDTTLINALVDSNPFIAILFNNQFDVIGCNKEALRFFGFSTYEAFAASFLPTLHKIIPDIQPTGRHSIPLSDRLKSAATEGTQRFQTDLLIDGQNRTFDVLLKREPFQGSYVFYAHMAEADKETERMRDMRALEKARYDSYARSRLLQAVNAVSIKLISAAPDTFSDAINDSLKTLGQAAEADRAYIWEIFSMDGRAHARQIYEWSEGAEPQQGKDFAMAFPLEDSPFWKNLILTNTIFNGPIINIPEGPDRQVMEDQGIRSTVLIPIKIQGSVWGFIGFDDCKRDRIFSQSEEQVLLSGGVLMISAILTNNATQHMLEQDKLRRTVNNVSLLLMESKPEHFYDNVIQALKVLAESTNAEHVAIWRNLTDEQGCLASEMYVGCDTGIHPKTSLQGLVLAFHTFLPMWENEPRADINVTADCLPEQLRGIEAMQYCRSLLLLPLYVQGSFWGFFALEHQSYARLYNEAQRDVLRTAGILIAFAILRAEINQNLEEARKSAEASAKAKSEFLSRMSHEIRTPLNAIIGMTELSKKNNTPQKTAHFIKMIDISSRQLLGIINDVLDMSKIDAEQFVIVSEAFDFDKMLRHVINVMQSKIDEKRLDFQLDFPQVFTRNVVSDSLHLSQVLINLLSNAVKFSPENGVVTLKIAPVTIDEAQLRLRIEVIDNGIGIMPDHLATIFEPFVQADVSKTRQYGGTGLGLAICKKIIALMDGTIWAESVHQQGSRFVVEIDLTWGETLEYLTEAAGSGLRTLVADGSPYIRSLFAETMHVLSAQCDTVDTGTALVGKSQEAIQNGRPYDLIFVDKRLIDEVGEAFAGNGTIVLMANASWTALQQEAENAEMQYFLAKPLLASDICDLIGQFTGAKHKSVKDKHAKMDWRDKTILLADDVAINREIVAEVLLDTGLAIEYADNGEKAVAMYTAAPEKYRLILMDVQMPMMDGLEATRTIRASGLPGAESIPIVAMTASAFKEDIQASLDAGMNDHINKPVDFEQLIATLQNLL